MGKTLEKILAAVGFFLFALGFMLASVDFAIVNPHFYKYEFEKNQSAVNAEISEADAEKLWKQMVLYFSGNADSLQVEVSFNGGTPTPFYGEDEISHMADVKAVVIAVRLAATILLLSGFILCLLGICRERESGRETALRIGRAAMQGVSAFLVLLIILAAIIAIDFNAAFVAFHDIFFPQGNWAFDPYTPMILLLPIELFMSAAVVILGSGIGFALCSLAGGTAIYLALRKPNPRRKNERQDQN